MRFKIGITRTNTTKIFAFPPIIQLRIGKGATDCAGHLHFYINPILLCEVWSRVSIINSKMKMTPVNAIPPDIVPSSWNFQNFHAESPTF